MAIAKIEQEGGGAMLELSRKQKEFNVKATHRFNFKVG